MAGERLLYYGQTGEGYRLFEVDWGMGVSRPLLESDHPDFRPSLSPDGERLLFDRFLFATDRFDDSVELALLAIDLAD